MRFVALFSMFACSPVDPLSPDADSGIQIGEEGDEAICDAVVEDVDMDEASGAMTFTPAEFLAEVDPSVGGLFTFADGSDAPVTVTLDTVGDVHWSHDEPREGIEPELCVGERYLIDVEGTVAAGSLQVSFTSEAWAAWPERLMWDAFVPLDEVTGLAPTGLDTAQWPTIELVLSSNKDEDTAGWEGYAMWSASSPQDPSGRGEDAGTWDASIQ